MFNDICISNHAIWLMRIYTCIIPCRVYMCYQSTDGSVRGHRKHKRKRKHHSMPIPGRLSPSAPRHLSKGLRSGLIVTSNRNKRNCHDSSILTVLTTAGQRARVCLSCFCIQISHLIQHCTALLIFSLDHSPHKSLILR